MGPSEFLATQRISFESSKQNSSCVLRTQWKLRHSGQAAFHPLHGRELAKGFCITPKSGQDSEKFLVARSTKTRRIVDAGNRWKTR